MTAAPLSLHTEHVVSFPDGLPGFEASRAFVLVHSPALDPFTIVQGVGGDAPSFVAIDPRRVDAAFDMTLDAADRARLDAREGDSLLWLALVSFRPDGAATVNLRAPLVVNPGSMRAIQRLGPDSSYRLDHPLPLE